MDSVLIEQMRLLTSILASEKAPDEIKDKVKPRYEKMLELVDIGLDVSLKQAKEWKAKMVTGIQM